MGESHETAPVRVLGSQPTTVQPELSLVISEKAPEYGHKASNAFSFSRYLLFVSRERWFDVGKPKVCLWEKKREKKIL